MENDQTTREDLGYLGNTTERPNKYRLNKELRMSNASSSSPEPSAVCRVRFLRGEFNGDVKRLAWEYAEPMIKRGQVELIEWI
ncbi:MAG TPA: hypothetical protein VLH56_17325 [Dissulfurispiraceae bacterium]|nr:hypothetical protein [Dissulfurispiraceae bacterium]